MRSYRHARLWTTVAILTLLGVSLIHGYHLRSSSYAQTPPIRFMESGGPDPAAPPLDESLQVDIPPPPYEIIGRPAAPIGVDTRTRVPDTEAYPYRAIAQLYIKFPDVPDTTFLCTGWLFATGPEATYAVTAAHCIYNPVPDLDSSQPPGIVASSVTVVPGQDVDATGRRPVIQEPLGSYEATVDWFSDEWRLNDDAYDYAILRLKDRGVAGRLAGFFGFGIPNAPLGLSVKLAGFAEFGTKTPDWAMWESSGPITATTETFLSYQIDTDRGNSGSPVWMSDQQEIALGIHTGSIIDPDSGLPTSNRALRINREIFDILVRYRQQYKIVIPLFLVGGGA